MNLIRSRRDFLGALAVAPILLGTKADIPVAPVRIAPITEPGEPLFISGVVYQADGATPAASARLFAYHTDRFGIYNASPGEPRQTARLKAWFSADQRGRYAFETIRPASYPGSTISAHIHVHAAPAGTPNEELFERPCVVPNFLFAGDRFLDEQNLAMGRELGRFNNIVQLSKVSGRAEGVRHIRLNRG